MPVIPQENEGQRLDQRSPVEAYNTSDAGIGARMISTVGTGLSRLGEGLVDIGKVRQAEKESRHKIKVQVFEEEMEALAQARADNAIRTSNPDGSNMVDLFNVGDEKNSGFDDVYKSRLDGEPDEDVRYMMASKAMQIQNKYTGQLRGTARAQLVEYGVAQSKNVYNQALAAGYNDPDNVDLATQQFYKSSKMTEGLLSPFERNKLFMQFQPDLAASRIEGYTRLKRFDDAARVLGENAGRFAPEEAKKISDRINNQRMEDLNFEMKMFDRKERFAAEALKKTQNSNFMDIANAQTAGEPIEERVAQALGQGLIRSEHASILNSKEDKIDKTTSDLARFKVYERALKPGADLDQLQGVAGMLVDSKALNADDALGLAKDLDALRKALKDRKKTDPGFTKLFSENMKTIEIRFGGKNNGFLAQYENPVNEAKANTVKKMFIDAVYFKGEDQTKAMNRLLKTQSGYVEDISTVPAIPGLNPASMADPQEVARASRDLKNGFNKGERTQAEYLQHLRNLKELQRRKQNKDQFNNGRMQVRDAD